MSKEIDVLIVAGGTSGHLNGAIAIHERLSILKIKSAFITGTRYLDRKIMSDHPVWFINSRPLRGKNILLTGLNLLWNIVAIFQSFNIFLKIKPKSVVGVGGYVCGPSLLAAKLLGCKVMIVEQNAVAGMTNKLLGRIADRIFCHFENTLGFDDRDFEVVGNPTRQSIKFSKNKVHDTKNILIIGGSLGSKQINDSVKKLVQRDFQHKVSFLHQVGKGNAFEIEVAGCEYKQVEYLDNIENAYSWANIIIARSGASTISELRIISKPSILIPFPNATDDHQRKNALILKQEDNFYVSLAQKNLYDDELANFIYKEISIIIDQNFFFCKTRQVNQVDAAQKIASIISEDLKLAK